MGSILIASALPIVRLGLRAVLREVKPEAPVQEAGTARQIEDLACADTMLAIIDPDIPELNPVVLSQHLLRNTPELPILFYGGHNPGLYASISMKLGLAGYLSADADHATIVATIRTILGGMRCLPRQPIGDTSATRLQTLSQKELTVLMLLKQGLRNKDIAEKLYLSEKTISAHKRNILSKLNIRAIAQLSDTQQEILEDQLALC